MNKARPTYDLERIQALVREDRYAIRMSAQEGADALSIPESGIVACVLRLCRGDFYKTMPAEKGPGLFQDVYRPRYAGHRLYVKLQISFAGDAVVISFKRL